MIKEMAEKSFTLIEILVYIGVFSVIIVTILDNTRRIMGIMSHEIKEARSIYVPTTTSNQVSLETIKYLPEGEITTYVDFYLCNDRLCFKKESQDSIFLTSESVEVSNLVFTRVVSGGNPSLQIDLTVDYKNPNNRPEYQSSVSLTSTASLRSY